MQRRDILKGLRDQWLVFEDGTPWVKAMRYPLELDPFQTFVFCKTGAKVRLVDAPGIPVVQGKIASDYLLDPVERDRIARTQAGARPRPR